jgi:hypothetical protein
LCYGLFCLVDARYRDVSVNGRSGARTRMRRPRTQHGLV